MIRGPYHNNRNQHHLESRGVYIKTASVVYMKNKVHFFQKKDLILGKLAGMFFVLHTLSNLSSASMNEQNGKELKSF